MGMIRIITKYVHMIFLTFCFIGIMIAVSTVVSHGATVPYATGVVEDPDGVNIRYSYSSDSNIVGSIPQNGKVTVLEEKFTSSSSLAATTRWYKIQSNYGNGYVRSDLLSVTHSSLEGETTGVVNVRKGPGTGFETATSFAKGTKVKVMLKIVAANGDIWYRTSIDGYYRYLFASYVKLPESVVNNNFTAELAAFPSSYHSALTALHKKYPSWHFKAKTMSYSWTDALNEQTANYKSNLIPSSRPDAYKMVRSGTYDFTNHRYIGLDGSTWVAASKQAVAYYMDPRNWLDEINVFMFESLSYDSTSQSEAMVKDILSSTAIPTSYSSVYMSAGETYDISPVYLAAKSRIELGTSDYMIRGQKITNSSGVTYPAYNAYNIGAYDSASGGADNGLFYAVDGTSYLRPWNTLTKAIKGGAMFIAEDFIGNNQHTLYYERFNVANGLSNIGTHQYMTNTMAAATQANITYWNYSDSRMLDTPFTFEIPVYGSMPSTPAKAPGSGNNNCYLDTLKIYDGSTQVALTSTFSRFTTSYTLKKVVDGDTDSLTVKTTTNASDAKVTVTGNTNLKIGENTIKVKVTSSSGLVKTYSIKVTKLGPNEVGIPYVTIGNRASDGKPMLTWDPVQHADQYKVYRSTSADGTYTLTYTTTDCSYVNTLAEPGVRYYYKVKAIGTTGVTGEKTSSVVYRICDIPQPVVTADNRASDGKVRLTWKAVDGATKYEIYRATSQNGTYTKMSTTTGTTYVNTAQAEAGVRYYYKVRAISSVEGAESAYSSVVYRICDLPQPVVTGSNRASDGKPQLTWKAIDGAAKYEVYRAESTDGPYTKMYTTTDTSYVNTASVVEGKTYYYKVRAISSVSGAESAYSTVIAKAVSLKSPDFTIGNRASDGKVQLTWNPVSGAAKYEIYRATSADDTYTKMSTTTATSYVNTAQAKAGVRYYYKIKAIPAEGVAAEASWSTVKYRICDLPQPVITAGNRASDGKVKLSWPAIEGAVKYEIYRSTSQNGTYTKMSTTTGTSYVNTAQAEAGVRYYYKVRAMSSVSGGESAYSSVVYRICDLPQPVVTAGTRSSDKKPQLKWTAVSGASKYEIYRATSLNGTYTKMSTTTGTTYTNTASLVSGTKYYYKVKAISSKTSGADSAYSVVKSVTYK